MSKHLLLTLAVVLTAFSAWSSASAQTGSASPYCQPYSYALCDGDSYPYGGRILSVTVGSTTYTSGCNDANSQYLYYNNLSPFQLIAGSPVTYKIDFIHNDGTDIWEGSYPGAVTIWIDFNGNNVFALLRLPAFGVCGCAPALATLILRALILATTARMAKSRITM
jgi:hypothetical protein